jgi:nicotinate-nucleotide adenylyltransferase
MLKHILIYGGSFDPPHLGHVNTVISVQQTFHFQKVILLPCKTPVLKEPTTASPAHRVHMLQEIFAKNHEFEVDLREILRPEPSYMINTLRDFREEFGANLSITLLMGMDAFLQLPQWHCWQTLLTLCHFLVIDRADINHNLSKTLAELLDTHETIDKNDLLSTPFGKIMRFNAGNYLISSSQIRQKIKQGIDIQIDVPNVVYQYIQTHRIY